MKSTTLFTIISTILATLIAAPLVLSVPLERRAGGVSSHLKSGGTFYRAVTGKEFDQAKSIYKVGSSPASHAKMAGDFSATGALYVFQDVEDANTWGNSWCKVDPKGAKSWYLVKMKYTPNPKLAPLSFASDDAKWKDFINANYGKGKLPSPAPLLVEGPISVGHGDRLQGYKNGGQLVWQGAFVGQALSTLKVESMTEVKLPVKQRKCCEQCNVM